VSPEAEDVKVCNDNRSGWKAVLQAQWGRWRWVVRLGLLVLAVAADVVTLLG
jgi:hypothetical protein